MFRLIRLRWPRQTAMTPDDRVEQIEQAAPREVERERDGVAVAKVRIRRPH